LDRFGAEKDEIAEITDYIEKKEIATMFDAVVERAWKLRDEAREEGLQEGYNQAKTEDLEQIRRVEEKNRRVEEENRLLREQLAAKGGEPQDRRI
jgi:transposase-like protein